MRRSNDQQTKRLTDTQSEKPLSLLIAHISDDIYPVARILSRAHVRVHLLEGDAIEGNGAPCRKWIRAFSDHVTLDGKSVERNSRKSVTWSAVPYAPLLVFSFYKVTL